MRFFAWTSFCGRGPIRAAVAVVVVLLGDLLLIHLKFPASAASATLAPGDLPPLKLPVLVLGAGVQPDKEPSPLLQARLQTALELFQSGRAGWILVSGDNRSPYYNEPQAMRRWLIRQGVPRTHIVADYAGRRTWDSLKRAQTVFGVHRLVVVTSDFHLPRALYIARALDMQAWGVAAPAASTSIGGRIAIAFREYGARHVALWDSWFPPATRLGPREPTPEDWLLNPEAPRP